MGLHLVSSKKKSHDLRDCEADDSHIHYNNNNNTGAGHVGKVAKKSGAHTPVRLLRSRTLSTEVDGRQSAIPPSYSNGTRAGFRVSQNGRGGSSGQAELTRLLGDTQPTCRWQEPLKQLLKSYLMPQEAQKALSFLLKNMDSAYSAVLDPSHSLGYPALYIDIAHKPIIFDLDFWKKILMALHFDLTEPEGNRQLDLIEVKVTKYVTLPPLAGFKILLESLSNMSWEMLRMVLAFTQEEALQLLAVMQDVFGGGYQLKDHQILQNLHARYPDQLKLLGFNVTNSKRHSDVTWHPPSSPDVVHHLEVALIGLYHDGSGLETYI